MSNLILPKLQGWSFEKTITPVWETKIYSSQSGRETRIQNWKYPRYRISIKYNFLTDNDIQSISLDKGDVEKMLAFFNSVGGAFNDFLYFDDLENSVENQAFAVGDGQTTIFQLIRSKTNWVEPVNGISEKPKIMINGTEAEATVDAYGVVKFSSPPAAGSILTWTGYYYFRVRFNDDELDLSRTWASIWENAEIKLITVK